MCPRSLPHPMNNDNSDNLYPSVPDLTSGSEEWRVALDAAAPAGNNVNTLPLPVEALRSPLAPSPSDGGSGASDMPLPYAPDLESGLRMGEEDDDDEDERMRAAASSAFPVHKLQAGAEAARRFLAASYLTAKARAAEGYEAARTSEVGVAVRAARAARRHVA